MTDEPLEPKAWDGRWLAVVFDAATETKDAGYRVIEIQRAATHFDAAMLARDKGGLSEGAHMMIFALPPTIDIQIATPTNDLEVPGPRWFKVVPQTIGQLGYAVTYVQLVSEDVWLRETRKQWTRPTPAPTPAAA